MKDFNVSEFLHFQQVDAERDITIGWNRFFPTIFVLNRFALELLKVACTYQKKLWAIYIQKVYNDRKQS